MIGDLDRIADSMVEAIDEIQNDDLAYLFATGKSELEIRNQIALKWHRDREPNQLVSREWKRHDLVILGNDHPELILEGKSWIHFDAVSPTKLSRGPKSIKAGIEGDLRKIKKTRKEYPNAISLISTLLFTIDVENYSGKELDALHIKYGKYHKQGIKKCGSATELESLGRSKLNALLQNYGNVKFRPIKVGSYLDCPVIVDLFLLENHGG